MTPNCQRIKRTGAGSQHDANYQALNEYLLSSLGEQPSEPDQTGMKGDLKFLRSFADFNGTNHSVVSLAVLPEKCFGL